MALDIAQNILEHGYYMAITDGIQQQVLEVVVSIETLNEPQLPLGIPPEVGLGWATPLVVCDLVLRPPTVEERNKWWGRHA